MQVDAFFYIVRAWQMIFLTVFLSSNFIVGPYSLGFGGIWSYCILWQSSLDIIPILGRYTVIDDLFFQCIHVYPYSIIIGLDYPSGYRSCRTCVLEQYRTILIFGISCVLLGYRRKSVRVGIATKTDVLECIRNLSYFLHPHDFW